MLDFEHSLPMLLLRAREAAMSQFRPVLSGYDLTEQQWRVLRALWGSSGLEAKELAERTLLLRPSLSGVLDRLQRDGLIERLKMKDDGRKVCVRMTPKAKRIYEKISPLLENEYAQMQARFSEKKWNDLYDSLFHLIELSDNYSNNDNKHK